MKDFEPTLSKPSGSRRRLLAFRLAAVLLGIIAACLIAELLLRFQQHRIATAESYDPPDLFAYDPELGWRLTPRWQGTHVTYDYQVRYVINEMGFRGDFDAPAIHQKRRYAVLGDSFTFGLGVGDDQTFVHLLNRNPDWAFLNFAVPGYSTDQEAILLEQSVQKWKPAVVLLFVYLGNDIFDNALPFPIQATRGKPCAVLNASDLNFTNIPVPMRMKSQTDTVVNLESLVRGETATQFSLRGWFERRSLLFSQMADRLFPRQLDADSFTKRTSPQLELFVAIIGQMQTACLAAHARFMVVLLPGRSFITRPVTESAMFQDVLRKQVMVRLQIPGLTVFDLAEQMAKTPVPNANPWYFPNDGHLTPRGHEMVAQLVASELSRTTE